MKIYCIKTKINDYQYFEPAVEVNDMKPPLDDLHALKECQPVAWPLTPPQMISTRPKLPRPDFWDFAPYFALAVPAASPKKVQRFLEEAGELHPFTHKSETFHVLNVLKCVDYRVVPEEAPGRLRAENLEGRIPHGLFRDKGRKLYVSEMSGDAVTEFKAYVEHEKMTGLRFHEVWDSGA